MKLKTLGQVEQHFYLEKGWGETYKPIRQFLFLLEIFEILFWTIPFPRADNWQQEG